MLAAGKKAQLLWQLSKDHANSCWQRYRTKFWLAEIAETGSVVPSDWLVGLAAEPYFASHTNRNTKSIFNHSQSGSKRRWGEVIKCRNSPLFMFRFCLPPPFFGYENSKRRKSISFPSQNHTLSSLFSAEHPPAHLRRGWLLFSASLSWKIARSLPLG